jgi:hypothetical protein
LIIVIIFGERRAVACTLRRYATSRKIPGSNPDEEIGFFFSSPNPASYSIILGSTLLLKEMSNRNLNEV